MTQLNLDIHKNKTNNLVKHEGIVSRISDKTITVSLKGNVNCEGCKAQSACGVSDSSDKEIEVIIKRLNVKKESCIKNSKYFNVYKIFPFYYEFLDSPSTTSATTYTLELYKQSST